MILQSHIDYPSFTVHFRLASNLVGYTPDNIWYSQVLTAASGEWEVVRALLERGWMLVRAGLSLSPEICAVHGPALTMVAEVTHKVNTAQRSRSGAEMVIHSYFR